MNKIVLVVEGGNVVESLSNINIQLVIIDYDLKKVGENFIFEKWIERTDQSELDKELKKITNA